MRLKEAPGDFRVTEALDFVEDRHGPYFIHRLRKEKRDTLEAISIVASAAEVDRGAIAFAGLKDRQGVTEQWISIEGKRVDFKGHGVDVRFVGRSMEPVTSKLSRGNAFEIVIRDLDRREIDVVARNATKVGKEGFANFFDDQRFSCLRHGQGFVMKDVLRGRWEPALKALIAQPSPTAITGDVKLKRILGEQWGDWERCAHIARGPIWRRLFQHLKRAPDDFRGALAILPARQKLIHAYAYQSFLWNRAVDLYLKSKLPSYRRIRVETRAGSYVSWRRLSTDLEQQLRNERTPLYAPGGSGGGAEFGRAMRQVLRDARLDDESFTENEVPGMVLREEPRALVVVPRRFTVGEARRDERNSGRSRVTVQFALPRGSYATMLIKHLFAEDADSSRRRGPRRRPERDDR